MSNAQTGPAARDVMRRDPISIAVDTPFLEVQHLFVVAQIGGAPVVGSHGEVLGIISTVDLLRAVDQACDAEVDGNAEELAEDLHPLRASEVMTPEVVWVTPDTPASQVARLMRDQGIHRVLVGNDGRLEGIITAFDLLALVETQGTDRSIQDDSLAAAGDMDIHAARGHRVTE